MSGLGFMQEKYAGPRLGFGRGRRGCLRLCDLRGESEGKMIFLRVTH